MKKAIKRARTVAMNAMNAKGLLSELARTDNTIQAYRNKLGSRPDVVAEMLIADITNLRHRRQELCEEIYTNIIKDN